MNRSLSYLLTGVLITAAVSFGCQQQRAEPRRAPAQAGRDLGDKTSDAAVTASVKMAFAAKSGVSASQINVDTVNGVVTLRGVVDNESEKQLATKVAQDTEGVKEVHNELTVQEGGK